MLIGGNAPRLFASCEPPDKHWVHRCHSKNDSIDPRHDHVPKECTAWHRARHRATIDNAERMFRWDCIGRCFARHLRTLVSLRKDVSRLVDAMLAHGADSGQVVKIITTLNDVTVRRVLELNIKKNDPGIPFTCTAPGCMACTFSPLLYLMKTRSWRLQRNL